MKASDFNDKTVLVHENAHFMATGNITGINFLGMIKPSERLSHYDIEITEDTLIEGDVVCKEFHCMGQASAGV